MPASRLLVTVLALALVTGLASCAERAGPGTQGPTGATAATGSSGPTGATAHTGTPSDVPTATRSPEIEDGRHFGYVRGIDVDALAAVFDLAYFLSGEEANQAAAEHGDEVPVPNDYYIVNDNPRLRTLALSPNVELVLLDWRNCCDETFSGDLEPFAMAIATEREVAVGDQTYQGVTSPYWLMVEGGVVTRIEE